MGPVKGMALIERLGFGAVIVDAQGGTFISSRLRNRMVIAFRHYFKVKYHLSLSEQEAC
jgi:hypothetical protein